MSLLKSTGLRLLPLTASALVGATVWISAAAMSGSLPDEFVTIWNVDPAAGNHSDSLFDAAFTAFEAGEFKEASRLFEQCRSFDDSQMHPDNPRRFYTRRWLAECSLRQGDSAGFLKHGASPGDPPPIDRRLTRQSDSLSLLANIIAPADMAQAAQLLKQVAEIERNAIGPDHPYYANTLYSLAIVLTNLDQFSQAIAPAREAAEIRLKWFGEDSEAHLNALLTLAYAMHFCGDPSQAAASIDLRRRIIDHLKGDENADSRTMQYIFMAHAADFVATNGSDPVSGERYLKEALEFVERSGKSDELTDLRQTLLEHLALNYIRRNQNQQPEPPLALQLENEQRALDYFRQGLAVGTDSANVAASHMRIGQLQLALHQPEKAIENFAVTVNYQRANPEKFGQVIHISLYNLAYAYMAAGQIDNAGLTIGEALDCAIKNCGEDSRPVSTIKDLKQQLENAGTKADQAMATINRLDSIATRCIAEERYGQADSLLRTILDITEENFGRDSYQYHYFQVQAEGIPGYGNPLRQRDLQYTLLDFVGKRDGKESLNYASEMMRTAYLLGNTGLLAEAIEMARQSSDRLRQLKGESYKSYLGALVTLSGLLINDGQFEEGRRISQECIRLSEKYYPDEPERIYNAMQNIVNTYFGSFDYGSALHENEAMEQFAARKFGEGSERHIMALMALTTVNYRLGDFEAAERYGRRALQLSESTDAINRNALRTAALGRLSLVALARGDNDEAVRISGILAAPTTEITPEQRLAQLHNSTFINFTVGNRDKVLELSDKTLADPYITLLAAPVRANLLVRQGYCRSLSGDEDKGMKLMERGLAMLDSLDEGKGRYILLALEEMMNVNSHLGDTANLARNAIRYSDIARDYIRSSFLTLPAAGRQTLWDQYATFMLSDFPAMAAADPSPEMSETAYNNLLLGKGLMLNTQREISDLIADTRDPQLQQLFAEFSANRRYLDNLVASKNASLAVDADSLKKLVARQEFEILKLCGDFMQPLSTDWTAVRASLAKDEAAVEFAEFNDAAGKRRYMAAVVTPSCSYPRLILLPEGDMTALWAKSPERLSEMIWKPLAETLEGVRSVAFSAAGELHAIPVETLADWTDRTRLVSDRWSISRLSSTRELVGTKKTSSIDRAVVYGGLRYDADPESLADDARRYETATSASMRSISLNRSDVADALRIADADTALRSGASYLPQTLTEANDIYRKLENRKIKTALFRDKAGTETSFKALSGQPNKLIHIATHGFSWSETDSRRLKNLTFLSLDDDNRMLSEDKAMSRCGLLFAGANNALQGRPSADGVDDGILLAREIADLDFRNLDLLVLSACETGLGDITGEGVFGLQRGFKKAGASAIMMSLWKVDDKATRMLMTQFYDLLLSGHSKREALLLSQKYLREYEETIESVEDDDNMTASQRRRARTREDATPDEPVKKTITIRPYAAPRFWAAFILLDAI